MGWKTEKVLLLFGIIILFPLIFFKYIHSPILNYQEHLSGNIIKINKKINQMNLLGQELRQLQKTSIGKSVPLNKRINSILHQTKLKAKSKIISAERPGDYQSLVVKLDQINMTEMLQFILHIEQTKPVILIQNIDISFSFQNEKLLKISMSLSSI